MTDDVEEDKLSALRMKRNTYSFIQRKRYSPTKHFSVKKKPTDPIAILKEIFTPRPTLKSKSEKKSITDSQAVNLPFNNMFLWAGGVFLAAILAFVLLAIIIAGSSDSAPPPAISNVFSGEFETQVFRTGSLTYGSQGDGRNQAYVILDYTGSNIVNATITSKLYSQPPSNQVFMLVYHRDGADTYFEFRNRLASELNSKGWQISDVRIDDLQKLPGGCTLIIPTGYLPAPLLGSVDGSTPSIITLAERGVSVIYIGQPFDNQVMRSNGELIPTTKTLFENLAIEFDRTSRPESTDGFELQSPFYTARTSKSRDAKLWGSLSTISRQNGYLIFVPETIDGGWVGDGSAAARDISRLITREPYRPSFASDSFSVYNISNKSISRQTRFFEPTTQDSAYLRVNFILFDSNSVSKEFFRDSVIYPEARGKLYLDNPVFTPEYLGGGRKTVVIELKELAASDEKLYFELYKNGTTVQQITVEQGLTNTQVTRSSPVQFSQDPGDYILRVVDKSSKVYAATKIAMAGVDISLDDENSRIAYSFRTGVFNATFSSAGKRIKVPHVQVYIENEPKSKRSQFSNTDFISYVSGIDFKRGKYTLVFDFGSSYSQKKTVEYFLAVNVWERPEIILMAIFGIAVFVFGIYMRRPEKEKFALDIPDFPPQSAKKISLSTSQIVDVFNKVNKDYHWETMPLSLAELKSGLRKLLIEGRPLIIGDYNLERILQRLEQKGTTSSYLNFWTLKSWEEQTGFNPRLMCTYRYLRDVFVNNAIRFSKLRHVKGCDVKVLMGRSEYYLHVYLEEEGNEVLSRALNTANLSHSWILFENAYALEKFKQKLSSSSSYLVTKMHVENKRIRLFTLDEFSKVVKTLMTRYSN